MFIYLFLLLRASELFTKILNYSSANQVKRFAAEVTHDQVALSGMRFFHVTRKLVMSVRHPSAACIVNMEV